MTPSNTLLRIGIENGDGEGGERSVHGHGMVDQSTTGGFERKEEERRGTQPIEGGSRHLKLRLRATVRT